jgi:hypothetical protein
MLHLFCDHVQASGLRNLQPLLGQYPCFENITAALRILRIASAKLRR